MSLPIPEVPGHPLWKNASDLYRRPLQFFRDAYLSHGPVFRARGPGRNYIIIAGPEANEKLLTRASDHHFEHAPVYAHIARELDSEHYVIATDGPRHVLLRRQVAAQLTSRAVAPRLPAMLDAAMTVCRRWSVGRSYQVLHQMHHVVGEQVGVALANRPLGDRVKDAITYARYSVGPGLGAYPPLFRFHPGYLLARRSMTRFLGEVIDDHRRSPPGDDRPQDFIDGLLSSVDEDGQRLSAKAVFANAQMVYSNSLLYGGPSVAFLLYVILRDNELHARLTAEVDAALEQPVTPELLCRLPTVMKVVKESMRLHPVALATPRVVRESFDFAGYRIPKGERVLIAGSVCHLLDEVHPDSGRIDLDRELTANKGNNYVPFGSGTHQCPAGGFMELVFAIAVVAILRTVKLETTPHDYTLRKVVNPFPEPARDFRFRVAETRP